jgi:hypothetical protein
MRRFLLISPYFPPSAVIGAKRPLNFVRHLPKLGWEPVVLAAPPEGSKLDTDLLSLVPPSTIVSRRYRGAIAERRGARRRPSKRAAAGSSTRTLEVRTSYLTPLDRFVWWTPTAVKEGLRLIREHKLEAIVVNADPWSGLLAGHLLHRMTKLPWIADMRDPWSLHESKMSLRPAPSREAVRRLEARFLRTTAKTVLNCESAYRAYVRAYSDRIESDRFTYIRNAFDESIYETGSEEKRTPFTLTYFGSFKPFVGAEPILSGFGRFLQQRKLGPTDARLRVIGGPVFPEELSRHGIAGHVDLEPALPLPSALRALRAADAVTCVVEPTTPLVIPGKLYDYLAARRPILAISANDEVNQIIERTRSGIVARFEDPEDAALALGRLYDGTYAFNPDLDAIREFAAPAQAERFAAVLDDAVCRRAP